MPRGGNAIDQHRDDDPTGEVVDRSGVVVCRDLLVAAADEHSLVRAATGSWVTWRPGVHSTFARARIRHTLHPRPCGRGERLRSRYRTVDVASIAFHSPGHTQWIGRPGDTVSARPGKLYQLQQNWYRSVQVKRKLLIRQPKPSQLMYSIMGATLQRRSKEERRGTTGGTPRPPDRVIFADVVQVVGDGALNIVFRIDRARTHRLASLCSLGGPVNMHDFPCSLDVLEH